MKKIIWAIVIALVLVITFGVIRAIIQIHNINQTEYFFNSNDGFKSRLELALSGSAADRLRYYSIPSEYTLDGEYAESYYEGLEKLISTKGKAVIGNEITGDINASYFAEISSRSSK
jgi:hypothetical protein